MKNSNAQAQILDAAMRHFAENGYRGASLSKIAKQAGVSKSLIFWYFENKSELFEALMDRFVAQCIMSLDIASPPGNPRYKLEHLMDTYWQFIQENYKFVRIFMNWLMQQESGKKNRTSRLDELHTKFRNILAGYLLEGCQIGIFRKDLDVVSSSLYLLSCLEGILLQMAISELSFAHLSKDFFSVVKKNILSGIMI